MGYSRPKEEGRALAYVVSILFSIGLAVFAAVAFSLRALRNSVTNHWSANWPTAFGQIATCDVKAVHGHFIDYALGIVGYSYQIDGNYYSGYLTRQFWDEQHAWTFVDSCKDKSFLVHYKLGRPQVSVLREVDQMGWPAGSPIPKRLPWPRIWTSTVHIVVFAKHQRLGRR